MKNKIMYLIIGMLIGAIITSVVFMTIGKNKRPSNFPKGDFNMEDGERPELPEGMSEEDLKNMPERSEGGFPGKRDKKDSTDSTSADASDDKVTTSEAAPSADSGSDASTTATTSASNV